MKLLLSGNVDEHITDYRDRNLIYLGSIKKQSQIIKYLCENTDISVRVSPSDTFLPAEKVCHRHEDFESADLIL